jgi:Putative prokaryotic signal transducing protein
MYCPQCGAQYREGFAKCSDCHVPLSPEPPAAPQIPEAARRSSPNFDSVVVLETNNAYQLAMAKGLLEDAGIPFIAGNQVATIVQDVDGFLRKWQRLEVSRECEAQARELLEPVLEPVLEPLPDTG